MAADAYWDSNRPTMIHLTVGFALIVAAAAGTSIGAVVSDSARPLAVASE